jgi:hypothetical protein
LFFIIVTAGCGEDDPSSPQDSTDDTAPAAITDLSVASVEGEDVTVAWTAPGDDGDEGTASEYHIRFSAEPVTDMTWDTDTPLADPPSPAESGTGQSAVIDATGLSDLYVAIKTADEVPNMSGLSNVASVSLTAPYTVFQLTTEGDNMYPCVNNEVVTWVKRNGVNGDEIYMRDLSNTIGTITRVTGNGGEKRYPSNIGIGWCVWQGRESSSQDWEIFFDSNLLGDLVPTQHTFNDLKDEYPAATTSGNFVWVHGPVMMEEIRHYDSGTHVESTVSDASCPTDTYSNKRPAADNGDVVWRAFHRSEITYRVTKWEGSTGLSFDLSEEVTANLATELSIDDDDLAYKSAGWVTYWDGTTALAIAEGQTPSLHTGRIAYVVWDGDYEIHYWDGTTIHEITDNNYHDSQPRLFEDVLVWVGFVDGGPGQIFYARLNH